MVKKEHLERGAALTVAIALETEAHALGFRIDAQSLNRAKNAVGREMAGNREAAIETPKRSA